MAGRALVFSNPDVIHLLQSRFIPYAGDQWYLHRQQDAVGQFFWKVVQQGHYKDRPLTETRQGIYAASPDGALLGAINSWSAEKTIAMLTRALEQWKPGSAAGSHDNLAPDQDAVYARELPAGGLILDVFSRIPLDRSAGDAWTTNHATGRDHLWLTHREWRSLLPPHWRSGLRYPVAPAIADRLIRFHLVDNVRGEPDMWTAADVRQSDLTLTVEDTGNDNTGLLRIKGTARLQHGDTRGYDARLQGYLEYDRHNDRITRFDLLSWGEARGEGTYTRGAPPGRFPLVIAFSLAGHTPADRIPPQAIRNRQAYLGESPE